MNPMPRMRLAIVLSAACLPVAAGPFESARDVLEVRCLECHTPKEAKGGLVMSTRRAFRFRVRSIHASRFAGETCSERSTTGSIPA